MDLQWKVRTYFFQPSDYSASTTHPILTASKGTWVHAIFLWCCVAFDGSATWTIGDSDNTAGYDTIGAAFGDDYVCQGDYLHEYPAGLPVANIGRVYGTSDPSTSTAQPDIYVTYTGAGDTSAGSYNIQVVYCQLLGETGIIA